MKNSITGAELIREREQDASTRTDFANLRERQSFYIVSVPGETTWYKEATSDGLPSSIANLSLSSATHSPIAPPADAKYPIQSEAHFGCVAKVSYRSDTWSRRED